MKGRKRFAPLIITVALAVVIAISLQTNTGASFVQEVKNIIATEKEASKSTKSQDAEVVQNTGNQDAEETRSSEGTNEDETQSNETQNKETIVEMAAVSSEQGIKENYVPEKEVILNIEGQEEKMKVQLNIGTDGAYVIYFNEERYKMINGAKSDIITTKEPLPEKYPEVSMTIKQVPDVKPEVLVKQYETELKKDFPELRAIEAVTEPVSGYLLHGINGNQSDSAVVHAYVISDGKAGSFIITEYYFLEAAEGHGARFHRMLETFETVE